MVQVKPKSGTLVHSTSQELRSRIVEGKIGLGDRLPSEARLCEEFGVSRTVIREAIAVLRADGLVEARRGSGVFVISDTIGGDLPFGDIDYDSISSVIEMLELRIAVEVEAAALAARRHAPAQIERIMDRAADVHEQARAGQPTSDADFALHLAIAEATNNPRFGEFLRMLGPNAIPRHALRPKGAERAPGAYIDLIDAEHRAIVQAILEGDEATAMAAMRRHLEGSQKRYRALLRPSSYDG